MMASLADLASIFSSVSTALEDHRQELNQADEANHNHGDHMVEVFALAARAADTHRQADLAEAMEHAADLLREQADNGSAQVYAQGLALLAEQLRRRRISLDDLLSFTHKNLEKGAADEAGGKGAERADETRSGEVLKALLGALAEWERAETFAAGEAAAANKASSAEKTGSEEKQGSSLDLGYLFGVGMAYMQAKQKGGSRLEVLAETTVLASPLSRVPYRHRSGVIAVRALLEALSGG